MAGVRRAVSNYGAYYFEKFSEVASHVLFGPLMACIASMISSSFAGLPHARPTFENAMLHSSSPELLPSDNFSDYDKFLDQQTYRR